MYKIIFRTEIDFIWKSILLNSRCDKNRQLDYLRHTKLSIAYSAILFSNYKCSNSRMHSCLYLDIYILYKHWYSKHLILYFFILIASLCINAAIVSFIQIFNFIFVHVWWAQRSVVCSRWIILTHDTIKILEVYNYSTYLYS